MSTLQTTMAALEPDQAPAVNLQWGKRKFHSDSNAPNPKKRRATGPQAETQTPKQPQSSTPPTSSYRQVYNPLLTKLDNKFEVKTMSVMPSTSINRHVDQALQHLGRFSPWDKTVRPGVVLLCAKSAACSKLVTIAEIARRRIGESDQKWFQYNVLSETVVEEPAAQTVEDDPSVVEDTFMPVGEDEDRADADDDEYFEPRRPTIHEQAVQPPKVRYKAHLTVLLSRVPLNELRTEPCVSLQTNEDRIEYLRMKR